MGTQQRDETSGSPQPWCSVRLGALCIHLYTSQEGEAVPKPASLSWKTPLNSIAAFTSFPRVCSQCCPSIPCRHQEHPLKCWLCIETMGIKQGGCRLAGVTLGGLSGPARNREQLGNLVNASGLSQSYCRQTEVPGAGRSSALEATGINGV